MFQHHGSGPESAKRIGNAFAGDIKSRAMDGFKHGRALARRINIACGANAQRTGQGRGQIRQDIGVQIGGDHGVNAAGLHHHARGHGIHQHLLNGEGRILRSDFGAHLIPHHHAVALRVGFRHHGQMLARACHGNFTGMAADARHAFAGEDGNIHGNFNRQAAMRATANAGIFAFAVLAHDYPINLLTQIRAQWPLDAGQKPGRAHIGVLVKALADREP